VRATPAERDAAQLRWLAGPSGYDNAIAAAMRVQIKGKGAATCATSIFCAYLHIVGNMTPGDNCDLAGRAAITNKLLARFLDTTADYIGVAKNAGSIQVGAGHIPVVKAHMDGEVPNSYMGIRTWKEFLEESISDYKVKAEPKIEPVD
jgi:hypothetical protein